MRSSRRHRSRPCPASLFGVFLTWAAVSAGCTLAPTVNVPTDDLKEAAKDLSTGMQGSAKEFGSGLAAGAERYRDEIREASQGVGKIAQSADHLVLVAKGSPAAVGEAVTQRFLGDETVRHALKSVARLAGEGEQLVAVTEKMPVMLVAKIDEMRGELTKADGVLTQQRTAIMEDLRKERIAISDTLRQERAEVMKDLDAYTGKAIEQAGAQMRQIVGIALLPVILLVLVLWGLPFGAGFLVGRLTRKTSRESPARGATPP